MGKGRLGPGVVEFPQDANNSWPDNLIHSL